MVTNAVSTHLLCINTVIKHFFKARSPFLTLFTPDGVVSHLEIFGNIYDSTISKYEILMPTYMTQVIHKHMEGLSLPSNRSNKPITRPMEAAMDRYIIDSLDK